MLGENEFIAIEHLCIAIEDQLSLLMQTSMPESTVSEQIERFRGFFVFDGSWVVRVHLP